MKIETQKSNEALIVHAVGRLDADGAAEFVLQMQDRCSTDLKKMILDFSGLEMLNAAGLRVLYVLSRKARAREGLLIVSGLQPEVREVFDSSGFVALYKIVDSVEDGLKVA